MVVSATRAAVDLLAARLTRGEYRDGYMDLQAIPPQDSTCLVRDLDADGLDIAARGEAFDIVYLGGARLVHDGTWKMAKLEEDEYR